MKKTIALVFAVLGSNAVSAAELDEPDHRSVLFSILGADSDGDGYRDFVNDAFPDDPGEHTDSDGDGVGDNADAFPNDPAETTDTDGDGVGDNADEFPEDPTRTMRADEDGDGLADEDEIGLYGTSPTLADTDGDGIDDGDEVNGDTDPLDADTDDDGIEDGADNCRVTGNVDQFDVDSDGIGDQCDGEYDVTIAPPPVAQQFGDATVLFAIFHYKNDPDVQVSKKRSQAIMESSHNNLAMVPWWREASYGASTLIPTYTEPLELPQTRNWYLANDPSGNRQLLPDALSLADASHGISSFDRTILAIPPLELGAPGCNATLGHVSNYYGFPGAFIVLAGNGFGCYGYRTGRHELAHTYGFQHAGGAACDDAGWPHAQSCTVAGTPSGVRC